MGLIEKLNKEKSLNTRKTLIILFLLFACMNHVPNQNGKVLKDCQVPVQML